MCATDCLFFLRSVNIYAGGSSSVGIYEELFRGSCVDKGRGTPICSVQDQQETGVFLRPIRIHQANITLSRVAILVQNLAKQICLLFIYLL